MPDRVPGHRLGVGSNDVLFSLLFNNTDPTDVSTFSGYYHFAATTMAGASEHLVIANIPDVTLTAYLTSVPNLAAILNLSVDEVGKLGLTPGDMVTPYAFPFIQVMQAARSFAPLPDSVPQDPIVIRAARLSQIRADVIG